MIIDSVNPATGEKIGQVESTPTGNIPKIVEDARTAQREWAHIPFRSRAALLRKFGEILVSRKKTVAELISKENGKPLMEAYSSEIIPSLEIVRYYAGRSEKILRSRRVRIGLPIMKTKRAFVQYEPTGVVGIISPWNYPLLVPLGQIVPALMAGNAVIFKPSEHTPLEGGLIGDFMWEAGIPRKLLSIVQGAGDVGAALITACTDKIFFTGSTAVGHRVSEAASRCLVPVSLELGSKDAMIVLPDADIDTATSAAIWGAFMNAGQTCVSVERCFVHEKIFDQFMTLVQKKVKDLRTGPGTDENTDVGAIINKAQFETVKNQVEDATKRGARVVAGGSFSSKEGAHFIPPTVLVDVPMDSLIMKEETFGPVLPITEFRSDDEAIALVNALRFGLSASIWTADSKHGMEMAKKLRAGAVTINDVISYYGIIDGVVGGARESGTGRVHGREGLLEMVAPKYYEIERAPRMKKLWWYRYDKRTLSFFETAVDFLYRRNIFSKLHSLFKLAPKLLRMKKL